jgi:beta-galactosidase
MPSRVSLEGKQLLIDGNPVFLRGAEVHYFRAKRSAWADLVGAAKDAGMNCLTSYIPWQWHEPKEGTFDFGGQQVAERDLGAFLDLAKERGLYFFARIGPFVNAELKHGGHPQWLFNEHAELRSMNALGAYARRIPEGDYVLSQLNPRYLELVFRWYRHVVDFLKPYSLDAGGPIVLMQVDNEPNLMFSYGIEGSLYDAQVLESGGLWQQWLERTYGPSFAARFGFSAGSHVEPPKTGITSTAAEALLAADWLTFKKWYVFEFIRRLTEEVRNQGIALPFTMNEPINLYWPWNSGDHASFARFMKEAGIPTFSSGHCYLRYGGEQNLSGAPVTIARLESVKMSTLSGPPSIYELGSWFTVPSGALGSYNWDIMTKLLLGCGMNGYSVYVFNDGLLPSGFGQVGVSYDWNSAINHDGTRNAPFQVLHDINAFIECWEPQILPCEKLVDATIGLSEEIPMIAREMRRPNANPSPPLDRLGLSTEIYNGLTDLFRIFTHLSVNFELTSLDNPNRLPGPKTTGLLIVPNSGCLSAGAVSFIESHVAAGGTAVFYPLVPTVDDKGTPLETLAALSGQKIARSRPRGGRTAGDLAHRMLDGQREKEVGLDTPLVYFDVPRGGEVLAWHDGEPIAYRVAAGAGHVAVVGFLPSFYTGATQRLLDEVLVESNGLRRVVCSEDGSVFVSARGGAPNPVLLAAAAIRGDDARTTLRVRVGGVEQRVPASGYLEMKGKETRLLWMNLSLPEGTLRYTTSQLIRGHRRGEYVASGAEGTAGQMAFDRRLRARVAGRTKKLSHIADVWVLEYEHEKGPLSIQLEP